MNSVRVNGEIASVIRMKTNVKKKCPQVDFLLDVPFFHPSVKLKENFKSRIRTVVMGDEAEWINDNLYEGAHLEIRHGFVQTWYAGKTKTTFYRLVGHEIDHVGSMQVPPFEPRNIGRFSGKFRKQWTPVSEDGEPKCVGISIAATPDMKWYGTSYDTFLSVKLFDELAKKVDGKLREGQTIDYLEGVLQPFKGANAKVWGLFVLATDIQF